MPDEVKLKSSNRAAGFGKSDPNDSESESLQIPAAPTVSLVRFDDLLAVGLHLLGYCSYAQRLRAVPSPKPSASYVADGDAGPHNEREVADSQFLIIHIDMILLIRAFNKLELLLPCFFGDRPGDNCFEVLGASCKTS